jgi:hypothetical protein
MDLYLLVLYEKIFIRQSEPMVSLAIGPRRASI